MSNTVAVVDSTPTNEASQLVAFSTIQGDDDDAKFAVLSAISDAKPMQEHLNTTIAITDIIIMNTTITDRNTGEVVDAKRTVVIDSDGTAYAAVSVGIIMALNNRLAVFGNPTAERPAYGRVVEEGPKGRQYYTIKWEKAPTAKK